MRCQCWPGTIPRPFYSRRPPFRLTAALAIFRTEFGAGRRNQESFKPHQPQVPTPVVALLSIRIHDRSAWPVLGNLRKEPFPRYLLPERRRSIFADTVKLETSRSRLTSIMPFFSTWMPIRSVHGWLISPSGTTNCRRKGCLFHRMKTPQFLCFGDEPNRALKRVLYRSET